MMSTLTNGKSYRSLEENLDGDLEFIYINRILDTLLTIPPEYQKSVIRIVASWIEAGVTCVSTKEKFGGGG